MSLTKIAMAKRQRRYWGGGDVDPEGTADAGRAGGSMDYGDIDPAGNPAYGGAQYSGTDYGDIDPVGNPARAGENTDAQDAANLLAFDRSQPMFQDAQHFGMYGAGLAALGRAIAGRNSGDNYGATYAGGVQVGGPTANSRGDATSNQSMVDREVVDRTVDPMQSGIAQTTPAGAAADTGLRKYTWDPVLRQYVLSSLGAGANPMGYAKGQVFQMAAGGVAPSGIAAGAPRFVQGGGTGLSDSVPVTMDDGGQGRLADGEFVIPADVVSGLGGGSSKAGADMLYQMMERIRQLAHGSKEQIRPVDPSQVMPA